MTARVLVVDDVELNVKLLEAKLSSEYFEVIVADNAPTALEPAESELPDIILLDIMMPRMDGFEVCRRLKANPRTADIPVVMVTALSDVADRLRGLESGADEFLTKPVNDTALFARVRSLVRLKRMMEELRLREEVCRQFGNSEDQVAAPEETGNARILLLAENDPAAPRIIETLEPGAVAARSVDRARHRQPLGAGQRPVAARLAMARRRGDPAIADPADRRSRRAAAPCQGARPWRQRLSRPSSRPQRIAGAGAHPDPPQAPAGPAARELQPQSVLGADRRADRPL